MKKLVFLFALIAFADDEPGHPNTTVLAKIPTSQKSETFTFTDPTTKISIKIDKDELNLTAKDIQEQKKTIDNQKKAIDNLNAQAAQLRVALEYQQKIANYLQGEAVNCRAPMPPVQ